MPQQGDKFGYYHLVKQLGTGGFAEVWLGEHELMQSEAAIKILHLQLPTEEERDKFLDEARHLAGFNHPNIVRILECGIQGNMPFLALEYAPNGTLRTRHSRGTRLPVNVIVDYVQQIAAGLQYAHDRRLIHRDVKPENMLIGKNNQILLSDFGVASVEKTRSFQQSKSQDVMGTVGYMAPEQFDGHPSIASDQYALAIVVYEWLCGSLPFKGKPEEIRVQQSLKVPKLRDKVPSISPALEQVVLTALSEDLGKRFRDMQAFADALEQAMRNPHGALAQGNPVIFNNPIGATNPPMPPTDPWVLHPVGGGANNSTPAATANPPMPNDPWTLNPVGGANNPVAAPNPLVSNTPPNGPLILNPGVQANNPLPPTTQAGGNNPYPGIPPLGPNIPNASFHMNPTVRTPLPGESPFVPFPNQTMPSTRPQRKRTKWFDYRNVFRGRNTFFMVGGGLIDFVLAAVLGLWLHTQIPEEVNYPWDLGLGSLLIALAVRAMCAASTRKLIAIPLAMLLAMYWFIGSLALITAVDTAFHIYVIPPHIIAIVVLCVGALVQVAYANKKK